MASFGTTGISHQAICNKCNAENLYCNHLKDEVEYCQACHAKILKENIVPITFDKHFDICKKCGGSNFQYAPLYGVEYYWCMDCLTITIKE